MEAAQKKEDSLRWEGCVKTGWFLANVNVLRYVCYML